MSRPLLVSTPWLVSGPVTGGISTRIGFPAATRSGHDDPARIEGRRILARTTGLPETRLAWVEQVHGPDVQFVDSGGCAGQADALVTRHTDLALLVAVADCGPVLLWDATAGIIAAVHAGWKGAVANICERTVEAMGTVGADTARIRAWIGPCIGQQNFEVGEEVAARFRPEFVLPPESGRARPHVDLPGAIRHRLREAGISDANIRQAGQCTFELDDRYWSYRRDGGICGRQFAWIVRADR
jgi:YfiH family protein